ncbi:MAG: hypothetical protein IJO49_03625 [Clostridia bacterium]|nr:hypothetical protein [Clostridia bacterium]
MLYPLKKWLVEALSSVSTNNNHYNVKRDDVKEAGLQGVINSNVLLDWGIE